jgi:cell division protein FtsW (lipid II flippase)
MFLALYVALRHVHPARMLTALYFAVLGAATFIVPRTLHLALLPLSDLYAAATSEAQRTIYLAAGEGLSQVSTATPQTLGFLFMAVAGLITSLVILQSQSFGKVAAYVGIVGFFAALANFTARLIAPAIAPVLMSINGLLWVAWWILISVALFRLARVTSEEREAV